MQELKKVWNVVFPEKLKWVAGKANVVDTQSDMPNLKGKFTLAMSNYIRNKVERMLEEDGYAGQPYFIVRVDGKSLSPRGIRHNEYCVVVQAEPSRLKRNDVVVLRLDKTDGRSYDIDFEFMAVDSYMSEQKNLNTYQYDENGDKIAPHPKSTDLLLGRVHSRVQFF
jgi:hypothetical protein